jgi:hypothetical protein
LATLVLSVLSGLALVVVDPGVARAVEGSWQATGSLNQPRVSQESALIGDGRVLVTGGRTATIALASAELYSAITEGFGVTTPMNTSRWSHTATSLPNGKVLVAGGFTGFVAGNAQVVTNTAEIYDPSNASWTLTPPMNVRRALHTEALLDDGRVLVAGGRTCDAPPATCDFTVRTNTAEIYDPVANTWTLIAPLNAPRHTTTAARLRDGRVLIPAGFSNPEPHETNNTADLYNNGVWSLTNSLVRSRARQGAMVLHDSRVVVGPGSRETVCGPPVCPVGPPFSAVIQPTAEIYDPDTKTWQLTGNPLLPGRFNFQQAVLPNGKALMVGGFGGPAGNEAVTTSAELYNPATNSWESAGNTTHVHGNSSSLGNTHDAIVLSNHPTLFQKGGNCGANCGKVLVVGDNLTDPVADLYTPVAPTDTTPPTCFVSAIRRAPNSPSGRDEMDVTVADTGSGVQGISAIFITNGTIRTPPGPGIPFGSTPSVVVTAVKAVQGASTRWSFLIVDMAGNTAFCA